MAGEIFRFPGVKGGNPERMLTRSVFVSFFL